MFRPEQNETITATDDPELAKQHGLTRYDKASGQYVAPSAPDAAERDGAGVYEAEHADRLAEGDAQHEAEHGKPPEHEAPEKEAKPTKATKSTAKSTGGDAPAG